MFAGVAALAGAVAIAIVLTREISLLCVDQSNLRALGLTRGQRVAVIGPAASIIAGGGALLAVSGAAAASPLFPLGVARRAEPDLGIRVDAMVLAVGVAGVALMVLAIAFIAARRATRPSSFDRGPQTRRRPSTIVERAARLGLGPTKTSGLRMALQPGSGETAVPVRSAFLASVFGVLGLTAVLVFASSLDLLVATPQRYGWNWDFTVSDIASPSCGTDDYGLAHQKGVATLAAVCYQDVPLDGRPVVAWSFTSLRGEIGPAVVAGRSPRGLREVALGSITLHALGKRIGDTVRAGVTAQTAGTNKTVEYRIVGEIVLPNIGDPQPLADGAAFTRAAFAPLADPTDVQRHMVGRFAPGIDRAATERRVSAIPQLGQPMKPALAVEVDHLRQIGWFPATLAMLLGGLALLAVGNALVTSVRRRRHELALLKTLGFDRRQVQATIAWQATTLVTVGLVVGIPAGLIIGDLVWRHIANGLGIAAVTTFPSLALILGIPVVLALVNLIAFFPARAAAQTRPGIALRSG